MLGYVVCRTIFGFALGVVTATALSASTISTRLGA
jgi:hypothetical protein